MVYKCQGQEKYTVVIVISARALGAKIQRFCNRWFYFLVKTPLFYGGNYEGVGAVENARV